MFTLDTFYRQPTGFITFITYYVIDCTKFLWSKMKSKMNILPQKCAKSALTQKCTERVKST